MDRNKRHLTTLAYVLILITILIFTVGCNNDSYRKVNVTRRGVKFSFEYPSSYQDPNYSLSDGYRLITIQLRRNKYSTDANPDTRFSIKVLPPLYRDDNAKTEMDKFLQDLQSNNNNKLEILNNSEIKIGGTPGYKLSYSAIEGTRQYFTVIYFDNKDLIWEIYIDAYPNVADMTKIEFDHIISSFQFLN
jgi:hypothetical protein